VDVQDPDKVDSWHWDEVDLKLLLQQFRGLKVTQQYKMTQKQLTALGPEGKAPLARVEMEMLGKVVNDFLAQLAAQLSISRAAAESAASVSQPDEESPSGYQGLTDESLGMASGSLGSLHDGLGTQDQRQGSKYGAVAKQAGPKGGARAGEGKTLTSTQVKKKNGLQKQREQLKAG